MHCVKWPSDVHARCERSGNPVQEHGNSTWCGLGQLLATQGICLKRQLPSRR